MESKTEKEKKSDVKSMMMVVMRGCKRDNHESKLKLTGRKRPTRIKLAED